jgi:hypothetical protein
MQAAETDFVRQRQGQNCVIAALATVIRWQSEDDLEFYGHIANALPPVRPEGIRLLSTVLPLLRLGWLAAPLISREAPYPQREDRWHLPTSDEIKAVLADRYAVVGYRDPQIGEHALAWTGTRGIDCSNGVYVDLENITICYALVLVPL